MASKQRIDPHKVVTNGDMAGNVVSQVMDIRGVDNISFQYVYTGAPVGTFVIEASLDGTTWSGLGTITYPIPAGAGGNGIVQLAAQAYAYIRTSYARTSGTGVLNIWFGAHSAGG